MISISLIGTYRMSGISDTYSPTDRVVNLTGFEVSGIAAGNILGVALYTYDYKHNMWVPASGGRKF